MGDIYDKLGRMANAAAYDKIDTGDNPERTLTCYEASAPLQSTRRTRFRNPVENFIFKSKLPGGGCAPMLKVLMTDLCDYNCAYCAFRKDRDVPRDTLQPEELTRGFGELVRRGAVGGIFISSGHYGGAARTMDRILVAGEMIRRNGFDGYLHLKIMPGADDESIRRAIKLGTRVSVNMEAPTAEHLKRIAPDKDFFAVIMDTFERLSKIISAGTRPRAGFTTQLV
ncbi:MAG: radical SAM protein, partial [bacterium]|nr:radical SAM protein [bacterium]